MSDDLDLTAARVRVGPLCPQCASPLPSPIQQLAVVHGRDGELLTVCSTACLAGLVAGLVGLTGRTGAAEVGRREAAG